MSCCVGQASLGVHLTVCVVCYAAKDWHHNTRHDDDRMIEKCRSIFKCFNVNNLCVCIGWCADQVTLRIARCDDKHKVLITHSTLRYLALL